MNLRGKISHIGHFLSKHAPYTVSNEGESRDTSVIFLHDISNGVVLESNCFINVIQKNKIKLSCDNGRA